MNTRKTWTVILGLLAFAAVILLVMFRVGVISFGTPAGDAPTKDLSSFEALPYTDFTVEPEERKQKTGVEYYRKELAYPGVNLYCNHYEETTGAFLIDMNGAVLHQWESPDTSIWKMVTVDENGNAYGILLKGDRMRLAKMDWNSRTIFEVPGEFHHDIQFMDDGSIVTLRQEEKEVLYDGETVTILDDYLTFISADGWIQKEISLFQVLRENEIIRKIVDGFRHFIGIIDIMHTNTCNILDRDIAGFCRKGNILLCMRNLDLILVYDHEAYEIVWLSHKSDTWQHPHEPTLLENGNLLIFDNGYMRGWSRVIEFNPLTKRIVWEYKGDSRETFFSETRGSIQRLPNGNTLITESDMGRAFEITRERAIVWEWFNPLFSGDRRSIVFKMKRLEASTVNAWLAAE